MYDNTKLSTDEINSIFSEEIISAGGTVHERWNDGSRLFIRSILPNITDVTRGDGMKGGVAIRADDTGLWVHPYTFRLVCTNGAIHAHAVQSQQIVFADEPTTMEVERQLRESIRVCCAPETFAISVNEMRVAGRTDIDFLLNLAPMLGRLPREASDAILKQFIERFGPQRRGTRFELANVITAAARTVRDPQAKWQTESLGGAVAAGVIPTPRPSLASARRAAREELMTA
jgi:hypothetical protein